MGPSKCGEKAMRRFIFVSIISNLFKKIIFRIAKNVRYFFLFKCEKMLYLLCYLLKDFYYFREVWSLNWILLPAPVEQFREPGVCILGD